MIGTLGSPPTRKYACSECGARAPNCRVGSNRRLPNNLSAEHALPAILRAAPAKQVHLELLEVEHVEHGFDGSFGHGVLAVIVEHAARRERMSRRALLRRDEAAILI